MSIDNIKKLTETLNKVEDNLHEEKGSVGVYIRTYYRWLLGLGFNI